MRESIAIAISIVLSLAFTAIIIGFNVAVVVITLQLLGVI